MLACAGCRDAPGPRRLTLVVPDGYRGIVRVVTDNAGSDAPIVDGEFVVAVPRNGMLRLKPLPLSATQGKDWQGVRCRTVSGVDIPSGAGLEVDGGVLQSEVAFWPLGRLVIASATDDAHDLLIGTVVDRDEAKTAPGHFAPGDVNAMKRYHALSGMGRSAYALGDLTTAASSARELLALADEFPNDWNFGDAVHDGNMLLGLVALRSGDITGARERLAAAGATPGSPHLDSAGPDMTLAKEMIASGEREAVLAYFAACERFWKYGSAHLFAWRQTVEAGGMPDFGRNLDH